MPVEIEWDEAAEEAAAAARPKADNGSTGAVTPFKSPISVTAGGVTAQLQLRLTDVRI